MTQYTPVQTSCFCLTIVRGFKCLSALKCWEPLLPCVPHWPRFQLFSARDNRRNGFITEHNTWVLFNMIVVKILIVKCVLCYALCFLYVTRTSSQWWACAAQRKSLLNGSTDDCAFTWISAGQILRQSLLCQTQTSTDICIIWIYFTGSLKHLDSWLTNIYHLGLKNKITYLYLFYWEP